MRKLTRLLCSLPLAGCTIAESRPADGIPAGGCGNEPLEQFIGQPATEELGGRMMQASGARILRWVPKGGVVTMDFSPDRLTIQLDGSNRVETARCG